MKKKFLIFFLFAFSASELVAQGYNTALGVRIGMTPYNGFGASLTQRLSNGLCAEAIYQSTDNRYVGNFIFKWHEPIIPFLGRGWNYYVGLGGHYGGYHRDIDVFRTKSNNFYGATGILGTEFTIGRFNLALDWMPAYSLVKAETEPQIKHDVAFSIRYVLFKAPKSKNIMGKLEDIFKDGNGENGGKPSKNAKKEKESKEL